MEVPICNAGITDDRLLMLMTEACWQTVIDTNLSASWRLAKRPINSMIEQRFGRLIFIGSTPGLSGAPGQSNYSASKAGLIGLARAITHESASRGITSNVIAPGFTDTDMISTLDDRQLHQLKKAIPIKRFATPDEIASAVSWLASDAASYVTGTVINIDGGLGMGN